MQVIIQKNITYISVTTVSPKRLRLDTLGTLFKRNQHTKKCHLSSSRTAYPHKGCSCNQFYTAVDSWYNYQSLSWMCSAGFEYNSWASVCLCLQSALLSRRLSRRGGGRESRRPGGGREGRPDRLGSAERPDPSRHRGAWLRRAGTPFIVTRSGRLLTHERTLTLGLTPAPRDDSYSRWPTPSTTLTLTPDTDIGISFISFIHSSPTGTEWPSDRRSQQLKPW